MTLAVSSIIEQSPATSLPRHWGEIIEAGTEMGRVRVLAAVARFGYRPDQVHAWRSLGAWHRLASLFYIFSDANVNDDRANSQLAQYAELLKMLDGVGVLYDSADLPIVPGGRGRVSFGDVDTAGDIFRLDTLL